MELIDYIDADEGRDFPPAMAELPVCDGCGKDATSLTFQPDWKIFACPACIAECEAQLIEEEWMRDSCTCEQVDYDRWATRGCIVHDRRAA
jgi:hypothetical protein